MDVVLSSAQALWQVVAVGLLLGAGLPAVFALGLRFWYGTVPATDQPTGLAATAAEDRRPSPAAAVAAIACFAVVILAVLFGIIVIVFGDQMFG